MLNNQDATATIAVKDLRAAKAFYEGKLGLKPADSMEDQAVSYSAGSSRLLVYVSQFAGTNQATAATWAVEDVEREVEALKGRGIAFEHYQMPEATLKGDVHISGGRKAAWFKDPDGNIHAVVSR